MIGLSQSGTKSNGPSGLGNNERPLRAGQQYMTAVTETIAANFERDGYLIVPDLFTADEAARLKAEMQAVVDDVVRERRAEDPDGPEPVLSVGVYVGLAYRSALFRTFAGDSRILDLLEPILGPDIEFLSDKAVFKDHDTDFGSPWHQDHPYWVGSHKISLWVALDEATVANGCLKLMPGSHRTEVAHANVDDGQGFGYRLGDQDTLEAEAVTAPLPVGGAIVFHDLTLHASHENASGADRWVWIPTYRSLHHDDPPYPWAVAAHPVRTANQT